LVALAIGCSTSISIKQDSPEAAVATLIKVYAGKKPESASALIDRAFIHNESATDVCQAERIRDIQCQLKTAGPCDSFEQCACSGKGVAASPKRYEDTWLHQGLVAAKLAPEACKILAANEGSLAALAAELDGLCGLTGDDKLSEVTFQCGAGSAQRSYRMVLRESDGKWYLIGLGTDTKLRLLALPGEARAAAKREKLNEELK
jgi:hypothetical protein